MLAEQQRAKSEIEAALTIAAHRPRDQEQALDHILTACQRIGLASDSQYEYSRGGTSISGPNIRLMEVIAQNWGNIEFGFRELARFPGVGGKPGESVVEAFAWDLETNTKRRTQFTVSHSEQTKRGLKTFTDPRDIYEWLANQAQRRVRTCLENIIPRDIQDRACEECDATLKTDIKITPDLIKKMLDGFAPFGITKEQIEARIQRHIDSITPAQVVFLRKVFQSLKDGVGKPEDWFVAVETKEPAKSPVDAAKETMRKRKATPPTEQPPKPRKAPVATEEVAQVVATAPDVQVVPVVKVTMPDQDQEMVGEFSDQIVDVTNPESLVELRDAYLSIVGTKSAKDAIMRYADARAKEIGTSLATYTES